MSIINKNSVVLVALGSVACLTTWYLGGVAFLLLLGLTLYVTWKSNLFPRFSSSFFLAASLLGIALEAGREMGVPLDPYDERKGRPLIGDNDGLWTLIFPFVIFWWLVTRALGKLLYKKSQDIKMSRGQKIMIGTILFFGVYFLISFIVSTIKGSQ